MSRERTLAPPKMKVHKKQKVTALVVKFESNVNGVTEEVTDHWNVDTVVIQGTPNMDTEKLVEGKLIDINE